MDNHTEPEPDLSVLKYRKDYYANKRAKAKDTLLLIEVADSSIEYDQQVKMEIYAKARIPEYWIIDLAEQCIEVYTKPRMGKYKSHQIFTGKDTVSASKCDFSATVASMLP